MSMKRHQDFLRTIICGAIIAAALATSACTSGYVGVRGGAGVVLQKGQQTGPVESSSNGLGYAYGLTTGGSFNAKIGLQFDPGFRTSSLTQNVNVPMMVQGQLGTFVGSARTVATMLDLPLLVTSKRVLSPKVSTMFGVGPHLGFRYSTTNDVNGVVTIVEGSDAGKSAQVTTSGTTSFEDDPIIGATAMAALDLTVAEAVTIRSELRLQHDFTSVLMAGYEFGQFGPRYNIITSDLPPTRLTLSIAVLFQM